MTMNPQVGDIWEYRSPKNVDPITVLLLEEYPTRYAERKFAVSCLDFGWVSRIVFYERDEPYWRKLA